MLYHIQIGCWNLRTSCPFLHRIAAIEIFGEGALFPGRPLPPVHRRGRLFHFHQKVRGRLSPFHRVPWMQTGEHIDRQDWRARHGRLHRGGTGLRLHLAAGQLVQQPLITRQAGHRDGCRHEVKNENQSCKVHKCPPIIINDSYLMLNCNNK